MYNRRQKTCAAYDLPVFLSFFLSFSLSWAIDIMGIPRQGRNEYKLAQSERLNHLMSLGGGICARGARLGLVGNPARFFTAASGGGAGGVRGMLLYWYV